jgi:hypothetical protein
MLAAPSGAEDHSQPLAEFQIPVPLSSSLLLSTHVLNEVLEPRRWVIQKSKEP